MYLFIDASDHLASLEQWKREKRTSAWLWIPIDKAHVIPIAAELGRNDEKSDASIGDFLC